MLIYRRSNNLELIGYSDSDYAGCVNTRKYTFGYLFLLADGAISWKSAKQSVIATSTMEAEFVACFKATIQSLWLRNFISSLGIVDSIAKPLRIYCDNTAAVFFSKNDRYTKGAVTPPTRHPLWVSSGGATLLDCDSLTFSFSSFRADTCIHMHNLCNNKNSFTFILYIPP